MAENPYINKVEANNQTLIDLTGDTATAGDVLEGRTLHLASGAPATGTYRPSDEIEARLESTVGHSCKNLLEITVNTDTKRGVTFTVDKTAGTISTSGTATGGSAIFEIPIPSGIAGDLYMSGCDDGGTSSTFYIDGYNVTDDEKLRNWSGGQSYNCYNTEQSRQVTVPQGKSCILRIIFARNVNSNGYVFKPMLRDGRISDDTFEPYVTPTDEKKQDKPVELDPTILTWNIADIQSKYTQLQIVCECIDTGVTPNMGLYDIITIPTVIFGRAANADKILAFTSTMTMNQFDTVLFTESSGNVSAYIETSTAYGTRTIIQIIGIPK